MPNNDYRLPDAGMLAKDESPSEEDRREVLRTRDILRQTLESFDIQGEVIGHKVGPRVTRFEIALAPGVRVKKVKQIAANIAMNLRAPGVRVVPQIPERSVVGVEVGNFHPRAVFLRSVVESEAWRNSTAQLPLALGEDIAGAPVVIDLAKAPHILISGATGTGKSVCMNSLIAGLLLKFRPDELKFVLIDLKIVEFEPYSKLPHLFAPVISDAEKAAGALHWIVGEIARRYEVLALAHAKTVAEFNRRPPDPEPVYDADGNEIPPQMPYLVVVIDELADLMMSDAKRDVETNITRIAQKGRAAGIHIIVATQRPSINIITGVIKANLPTRFCFQVRSCVDSRVVLDAAGAEQLLGQGDMLFMSPSGMNIERVQGAYIADEDLRRLVETVSRQAEPEFSPGLMKAMSEYFPEEGNPLPSQADFLVVASKFIREEDDDLIRQAVTLIILERKASVSYLQRRLKIGYNRAAEILAALEKRELVSPLRAGGKREILANFSQK